MLNVGSIGDVPSLAARVRGRRTALIHHDNKQTYDDLDHAVSRLAARLRQLGVARGERVALFMENRPEYLFAYFAVPAAGGVLVPLNTFLAAAELEEMLLDSGATTLLTSPEALPRIAPALRKLQHMRDVVLFGESSHEPAMVPFHMQLTCFRESQADDEAKVAGEPTLLVPEGDDTAVLIYTSGTTGRPKGVMLTHRNLLSNAEACIEAVGVTQNDRLLLCLPMFHSFTEMVGMLAPVVAGMSIILLDKLDRAQVKRALLRHRPTIFPAVPAVFAAMSQVKLGPIARWMNPVRLYISGGAPLSLDTLRRFEQIYGRPLCEGYGLSEASPVVALNPPSGPRKAGSVGLPLPGVDVMVADEAGRNMASEETGELLVAGPSVMKGYLERPEETSRALRGGWLHTGDFARRDGDGYLFIMGRAKEMLICRGMNVYPREIEDVLEGDPRVKEAAVIGVPDAGRGEVPVAFVVRGPGERLTESELKRVCVERLARYKVPRTIHFVEALPRNAAGKILKQSLAASGSGTTLQAGAPPAGQAARERQP